MLPSLRVTDVLPSLLVFRTLLAVLLDGGWKKVSTFFIFGSILKMASSPWMVGEDAIFKMDPKMKKILGTFFQS